MPTVAAAGLTGLVVNVVAPARVSTSPKALATSALERSTWPSDERNQRESADANILSTGVRCNSVINIRPDNCNDPNRRVNL